MKKLICLLLVTALILTCSLVSYATDLSDYYDNTMTPNDFFQFGCDSQYIYGAKEGMTCQDVLDYCNGYGLSNAYFYSFNGTSVTGSTRLCTGMQVNYFHGPIRTISVYGDVNGDGYVDSDDYSAIKNIVMTGSGAIDSAAAVLIAAAVTAVIIIKKKKAKSE